MIIKNILNNQYVPIGTLPSQENVSDINTAQSYLIEHADEIVLVLEKRFKWLNEQLKPFGLMYYPCINASFIEDWSVICKMDNPGIPVNENENLNLIYSTFETSISVLPFIVLHSNHQDFFEVNNDT
jgi:hypothetical protein